LTKVKRKPIQKCKQKSLKLSRTSSNTSTSIHKKTRIVEEVNDVVTSDEKWLSFNRISTNLIKRKTFEDTAENTPTNSWTFNSIWETRKSLKVPTEKENEEHNEKILL
jgi:hypothetical protein